jgi:hypothetical protein
MHKHIRGIDSYMSVRRDTIGATPSFALLELDMDIPDNVINHPYVKHLTTCVVDMIILGNVRLFRSFRRQCADDSFSFLFLFILIQDICSYNVEQARGDDGHNIVTIAMHELDMDIHGVMEWIALYHEDLVARFLAAQADAPTWGDNIDTQLATYIDGLANWVRANDAWSFESDRYFGRKGKQIQKSRMVQLLPRTH